MHQQERGQQWTRPNSCDFFPTREAIRNCSMVVHMPITTKTKGIAAHTPYGVSFCGTIMFFHSSLGFFCGKDTGKGLCVLLIRRSQSNLRLP